MRPGRPGTPSGLSEAEYEGRNLRCLGSGKTVGTETTLIYYETQNYLLDA